MIETVVTTDLATCRALRRVVFIEEQGVSEADEVDDLDPIATHILARIDGTPTGCARIVPGTGYAKIGRVCVLASARGTGLGAALMQAGIAECRRQGYPMVKLGAQLHALGFYERLGFVAHGEVFDDAGIPHREMVLTL
ncbi:GNAT family N-acetyltransferase [Fuscibacter oryzae]|uniref:GNAT family N-acetyltransferase n=1 Tax=Fuscibacter oryzae TaxID=2803939 RepID=A0A8J7MT50_9RHOB|nr:GNAT family N-acetyltransferase [Fuscibacter oryzae]MBL4929152.1 GNAT family N-acetyltransferase [Fuscibacter oryzae]